MLGIECPAQGHFDMLHAGYHGLFLKFSDQLVSKHGNSARDLGHVYV